MWVNTISLDGHVHEPEDWTDRYALVRERIGNDLPGYITAGAVGWSALQKKWYILPRKASTSFYNVTVHPSMGTNHLLTADEDFIELMDVPVGEVVPTNGFFSFKFLPGTEDDIIVALKMAESPDNVLISYVLAFDVRGKILMPETLILNGQKFEGIEFI